MKKLLMLGLSLCCTTGLLAAVEFSTEKLKLEFAAPEAGMGLTGVTDLASGQKFFPAPAANAPLWQLEFAGGEPAAIRPHSHTPAVCSSRETAIDGRRGLELVWDQIDLGPEKDALQVVCRIRETDDGEVEMTLHPTLKSKVHTFNSQFFPRFANALATPEDEVLFPRGTFGSRLVRSAEHGTYPSVESQLQFFGFYRDGAGLYLGIHDGGAACKYFKLDDDGSLQVQTYAENTLLPGQSRLPAFAVQLAGSPTPWHATRRYRQWALRQPWTRKGKLKERRDVPAAARNIALWVLIWGDPEAVAAGFQAEQQHQEGTLALHWYLWNRYPFDHHYPEYFPVKDRFTDTVEQLQQDGDIVNIDYKGTKDGEAFDGGTAEGQDLTLGSGSMIDGFEDGLVGAKKGETKTLDLTFPENYREESLAGQAVVFEVTVNAVKEKQDAVLDDAFVQRTSDYQTVDEYKEGIRADLLAQKQKTAEQEMEQDVLQDIIDNSDFKFSRNGLSVRYNQMLKQYTNQAKMYGMTLSQMAQANGMDEAGFKEYIYSSVKEAAKKEIVVKDIAAKEGLDNLTDEDKEAFAQANGTSKDTLVSLYGEDTVNEQVLQDKVLRFLASNADNEAENPAKLSEREVTVTETSADQESSPEETTEAETTAEETKAN